MEGGGGKAEGGEGVLVNVRTRNSTTSASCSSTRGKLYHFLRFFKEKERGGGKKREETDQWR